MYIKKLIDRRNFLKSAATATAGAVGLSTLAASAYAPSIAKESGVLVIGPMEGYAPQVGTLVSMLNYNRYTILQTIEKMTVAELDYLHDAKANTIGALVLHLGAVEKYYQINTFEGRQEFNEEEKKIWNSALELGDAGRKNIKGHDAKYYTNIITEVRQKTLEEFKKKDDKWLLAIDPEWSKEEPLNTYWKWFHVCEHESNHRGQIAFIQSRLPGAKETRD
jgi:uncharacterized damage-inducible protein DinB